MCDLSPKIGITLQPVFVSRKLEQDLKHREITPLIVNQQCVVYSFTHDLCDSDYRCIKQADRSEISTGKR